jgi:hypothetical protein
MLRLLVGCLVGVAVAFVVVTVVETTGHLVYPPPPDVDLAKPEAFDTLMERLPLGAIVAVLIAWAAGAFAGGGAAAAIARRPAAAWIVGALMMAAAIATMVMIPHPAWFVAASFPAALVPAWIAGRMFGHRS